MFRVSQILSWPGLLGASAGAVLVAGALSPQAIAAGGDAAGVAAIEVEGNRRIDKASVLSQLGLAAGGHHDEMTVNKALKALYATGLYADARIDRVGERLIVRVAENPLLASVKVAGNSDIEEKVLLAEVGLKAGQVYTRVQAQDAARRLVALYAKRGRIHTDIEPKADTLGDGRVALTFAVKEADVAKLISIRFAGNTAFREAELKDAISSAESGWFDIFKSNVIYDKERIELDRELVAEFYRNRGYADVAVVVESAPAPGDAKGYVVTFKVDEGDRFVVGDVKLAPKIAADEAALRGEVTTQPGEVFDPRKVEATIARMNDRLAGKGPTFAQAFAKTTRDPVSRTIGITYAIDDGPHVRIERIEIAGNTKTREEVIRRELAFAEGDPLNASLVAKAKKKLKALGFFKAVEISTRRGASGDQAVLIVKVEELDTRELGFGIGYSTSEGVTGDVSFGERNLLGNGQYLKVKLAGSQTRMQAEIGFTEPRFLDRNLAAGFDLFYRDTDLTKQSSYKSVRAGGTVRLGFPITETISGGLNYTFSRSTLYDVGPNASAAIREAAGGVGQGASYNTSSVGYSLAYDTRDRKANPLSGVYVSGGQDLAGVGGDVRYVRTVSEARGYLPVGYDITLAGRAIGGTITGWGGSDVRLLDLFYKGGDLVRGFAALGMGPRDLASANRDALGGSMFYGTTLETRFPVPGVPQSMALSASLFADAGSVWRAGVGAQKLPGLAGNTPALRASVGVGLAWESPIGPLRVDYAVPVARQPFDKTQPLSFGLGPGF